MRVFGAASRTLRVESGLTPSVIGVQGAACRTVLVQTMGGTWPAGVCGMTNGGW